MLLVITIVIMHPSSHLETGVNWTPAHLHLNLFVQAVQPPICNFNAICNHYRSGLIFNSICNKKMAYEPLSVFFCINIYNLGRWRSSTPMCNFNVNYNLFNLYITLSFITTCKLLLINHHNISHDAILYHQINIYSDKLCLFIYWMFYDHLSADSLLDKLGRWGWLMKMRLAWKKSQNTLASSKRLHRNKTRSTGGACKGLDPNFSIIGLRTRESTGASRLKAPSGEVKKSGQVAPTTRSQGGGVQSFWT